MRVIVVFSIFAFCYSCFTINFNAMKIKIHLALTALILITLGVICVLNPLESFVTISWLIGLLILLSGVITLLFGLRAQAILPNAASTTLLAIFQIVIGCIFMLNTWIASGTLTVVFAMWMLFESISILVGSIDYKRAGYQQWWLMLIFGAVSIALSFVAICNPEPTALAITSLLGVALMAIGFVRLAAIPAVGRLQKRIKEAKKAVADQIAEINTVNTEAEEV